MTAKNQTKPNQPPTKQTKIQPKTKVTKNPHQNQQKTLPTNTPAQNHPKQTTKKQAKKQIKGKKKKLYNNQQVGGEKRGKRKVCVGKTVGKSPHQWARGEKEGGSGN